MSIFQSIHQERKMSFKHWRYRLLHWAFDVRNPDQANPKGTGLPDFFYTHYCPLFHVTNLILLFSWLILLIKVGVLLITCCVIGFSFVHINGAKICSSVYEKILKILFGFFSKSESHSGDLVSMPPPSQEDERELAVALLTKWMMADYHRINPQFDSWWVDVGCEFKVLDKEAAALIFVNYLPKIMKSIEAAKERKARLRELLLFWINMSRGLFKVALYGFYIGLGLLLAYIAYSILPPVVWAVASLPFWCYDGFMFVFNLLAQSWSNTFVEILKVATVWVAALLGLAFLYLKLQDWPPVRAATIAFRTGIGCVLLPFNLFPITYKWLESMMLAFVEFASTLYEQSCPPIVLVDPKDEKIEQTIAEKQGDSSWQA